MKQHPPRTRFQLVYLILIMVGVAVAATGTSIWLLYQAAFDEEKARLVEAAQSQARLIESVARFDAANSRTDHPEGAAAATLSQVVEAHKNYKGFGNTGEFTLARREGDQIVYLLSHRHSDLDTPKPVAWNSHLAAPMRRALKGLSGTLVGLDYRNVTVLAAHEPVAELNVGIVAKIDLEAVRAPFVKAAATSFAGVFIIIVLGTVLFRRVSAPLVARDRAERELARRTATLEAVLEHLDEGISMVDANLKGAASNKRFFELLEIPVEKFPPGTPYEDYIRFNARRGDYGPGDVEELVRERVEQAKQFEPHMFERTRPNGSVIEVRGNPIPGGGMVTSYTDITERKKAEDAIRQSEERYRGIFNANHVAILTTSIDDGRVIDANERVAVLLGYEDRESFVANFRPEKHWLDMADRKSWIGDGSDKAAARDNVIQFRKLDGTAVWLQTSSTVRPEANVIDSVSIDVTESMQYEASLRAAREEAELANRVKSEFLANMSHELRTPLNAIIGFSEMMMRQTFGPLGDAHYKEYSGSIFESGEHLLSLINDILDISRIEAGEAELNEAELDLAKISHDCRRLIEPRANQSGLSVRDDMDGGLPMLRADERLVKQMLLNLLSNAVKFTDSGGEISVAGELTEDGVMKLSVSDTGIGIAAIDIPKALATFGQVDGDLDRKFEGTGLGLPLVKSMVELHGGGLDIESDLGVGTEVSLWFPSERVIRSD